MMHEFENEESQFISNIIKYLMFFVPNPLRMTHD